MTFAKGDRNISTYRSVFEEPAVDPKDGRPSALDEDHGDMLLAKLYKIHRAPRPDLVDVENPKQYRLLST